MHVGLGAASVSGASFASLALSHLWGSGETRIQETNALLWVMIAISATGTIITFSFLVYSLWKFRDPKVKNRRYG